MVAAQLKRGPGVKSEAMSVKRAERRIPAAKKRSLRARAHKLKPVVIVGASGVSRSVIAAIEQALDDHELIKVRVNADDRAARRALIDELCVTCRADLVQTIGHVAVLFREAENEALGAAGSQILDG
jgi:RNA-binding protein